jgi:predicted nucleic acid-binding protein
LIEELIANDDLLLSPLVIQELIFVLNKLYFDKKEISRIAKFFIKFSPHALGNDLVLAAYDLCFKTDRLRCINDATHLKFAERYGSKLVTFDEDFKKFKPFTNIEIEILQA